MLEPDRWAWRPQEGPQQAAGGLASMFRRTCNLHACGLGVACRELRASRNRNYRAGQG